MNTQQTYRTYTVVLKAGHGERSFEGCAKALQNFNGLPNECKVVRADSCRPSIATELRRAADLLDGGDPKEEGDE